MQSGAWVYRQRTDGAGTGSKFLVKTSTMYFVSKQEMKKVDLKKKSK